MEWFQIECEVIVADYLAMLGSKLKGESYQKAAHRRSLQAKLNDRCFMELLHYIIINTPATPIRSRL